LDITTFCLKKEKFLIKHNEKILTIRIIQAEKSGKVDDVVYVDGALLVEGNWNAFYLYALHMEENN
jgi:predicted GH43/DUF377 family glycosyl hydrolase